MRPLLKLGLGVTMVLGLLAGGGWLLLAGRDAPQPARLQPASGAGGVGRPDGEWVVARTDEGFVGYRIRERLGAISAPNDVVGRAHNISGTVVITGGALTAAQVTVDMTTLRTDMEPRDGRMRDDGLETLRYPTATFTLTRPIALGTDGSGRKDLALGGLPDWSPDGRRIAFVSETGGDGAGKISVMGADGSAPRQFSGTPTSDSEPRWSPDGRRIAVSAYGGATNDDIAVIEVGSGRFRRLTRAAGYEDSPAWSPDGRRIAYVKDGAVHLMRADGSGDRAITTGRADSAPNWSPDGRRLSWVRDGNLYLARTDGSGAACLRVGLLLTSGARWQPGR